jgi:hypothetical protein
VTDWSLAAAVRWSDMSVLEYDRRALVLNRFFWLSVGVLLWRMAVRLYPRVDRDPVRFLHAAAPRRALLGLRPTLPFLLVTVVLGALTWREVNAGPDGARAEKIGKDYWRKNLATWRDAAVPWTKDAVLGGSSRATAPAGQLPARNHRDTTFVAFLTVGRWSNMRFTVTATRSSPTPRRTSMSSGSPAPWSGRLSAPRLRV